MNGAPRRYDHGALEVRERSMPEWSVPEETPLQKTAVRRSIPPLNVLPFRQHVVFLRLFAEVRDLDALVKAARRRHYSPDIPQPISPRTAGLPPSVSRRVP